MSKEVTAITRRRLLRSTAIAAGMVGTAALPGADAARAQPPKQTKTEAAYQDQPNGQQRCGICAHFMPPAGCEIVEGTISPNGWCRNFKPRT